MQADELKVVQFHIILVKDSGSIPHTPTIILNGLMAESVDANQVKESYSGLVSKYLRLNRDESRRYTVIYS